VNLTLVQQVVSQTSFATAMYVMKALSLDFLLVYLSFATVISTRDGSVYLVLAKNHVPGQSMLSKEASKINGIMRKLFHSEGIKKAYGFIKCLEQ
jgi:hypothetical protein